ncbi:hypothetical protein KEM56_002775 [Ascosphaera pollenicola]|nr:hypothetical protein KEM56_002775 [Ascosphaera pollenicola]
MVNFKFFSLAYLAANAFFVAAQEAPAASAAPADEQAAPEQHNLNITAHAIFPDSEFGVKIVNGKLLNAGISIANYESEPISVNLVAGQLSDLESGEPVRNLTMAKYQTQIPAGEEQIISYPIQMDMHPADLALSLTAFVTTEGNAIFTLPAFNGVVSVVEPETSIFDLQILFLYFFLGSLFVGTIYFFYTVWVVPYLSAKQRKPAASKTKTAGVKDAEKTESAASSSSGSDVASGASYNTEWIPAHHIARPEARKVKGSARKTRS